MICKYGIKLRGLSHEKEGTPCQDAFAIVPCGDDMVIAAVADGLGSCAYSDLGSQKAVDVAARYCKQNLVRSGSTEDILQVIRLAFLEAQSETEKDVESRNHDLVQYHTTLSLAVLIGDTLYYGHSGDSGIIALTTEGRFEKVTKQQRDEDGHVFPLFSNEDLWDFGQFDKVCSVLLATDGMLECLLPRLLKNEPYVNIAGKLMDNRSLHIDKEREDAVKEQIENYVKTIPPERVGHDDLTIVALVNTSIEPRTQPMEYYKEPNWAELIRKHNEEFERAAYPCRFEGENREPATNTDLANSPESKEVVVSDDESNDISTDNLTATGTLENQKSKTKKNANKVTVKKTTNPPKKAAKKMTKKAAKKSTKKSAKKTSKKTAAKRPDVKKGSEKKPNDKITTQTKSTGKKAR